jgi:hypothetical protein
MTSILLMTIFAIAGLSLISYLYCWHDLKGGRPHIISLRQITGVMDREQINAMFGKPEPGYYYRLEPAMLRETVAEQKWRYYGEVGADAVCLLGCYYYLNAGGPMVVWFILLAGACQAISVGLSVHLVRKWWHQLAEEMDDLTL